MASKSICDNCGREVKTYVMVVSVGVNGFVRDDIATGTAAEKDICEDCFLPAAASIGEAVASKLVRDLPIHKQVDGVGGVNEEKALIGERLSEAVRARDGFSNDSDRFAELNAEVQSLVSELKAAEEKRLALLRSAE